ncbi:hypothetical protein WJX73_007834 [Symbiochloris irregularis]|uniref:F-box domain-containing protein n=1 Tax=Symbiochloris irregularis TaxID=706552 RepID=A0AAW1PND9_9CHLO
MCSLSRVSSRLALGITISLVPCLLLANALPQKLDQSLLLAREQNSQEQPVQLQADLAEDQYQQSSVIHVAACEEAAARLSDCTLDKVDLYEPEGAQTVCCEPYEQLVALKCFCAKETRVSTESVATTAVTALVWAVCPNRPSDHDCDELAGAELDNADADVMEIKIESKVDREVVAEVEADAKDLSSLSDSQCDKQAQGTLQVGSKDGLVDTELDIEFSASVEDASRLMEAATKLMNGHLPASADPEQPTDDNKVVQGVMQLLRGTGARIQNLARSDPVGIRMDMSLDTSSTSFVLDEAEPEATEQYILQAGRQIPLSVRVIKDLAVPFQSRFSKENCPEDASNPGPCGPTEKLPSRLPECLLELSCMQRRILTPQQKLLKFLKWLEQKEDLNQTVRSYSIADGGQLQHRRQAAEVLCKDAIVVRCSSGRLAAGFCWPSTFLAAAIMDTSKRLPSLPDEVWCRVFHKLSFGAKINCERVSRHFHDLLNQSAPQRNWNFDHFDLVYWDGLSITVEQLLWSDVPMGQRGNETLATRWLFKRMLRNHQQGIITDLTLSGAASSTFSQTVLKPFFAKLKENKVQYSLDVELSGYPFDSDYILTDSLDSKHTDLQTLSETAAEWTGQGAI